MAIQEDLDAHYTVMDKIFRFSVGEKGAYSCARFDGDYSLSLEEAQDRKYQFIVDGCQIKKGTKVLDIGCGWGAFINDLNQRGAETTGVVLAKGQADACIKNGLNVRHMDSKDITSATFGKFDVVTAMGSPEHLCSVDEFRQGKQDEIYKTYFNQVSELLPIGGRFYCQTMVFGPKMVKFEDIPFDKTDIWKDEFTDEELMDIMCRIFPGSWLPYGKEGIIDPALDHFKVISVDSGRLDYIETIKRWSKAFVKPNLRKYLYYAAITPRYLLSPSFRAFIRRWKVEATLAVFERLVFEHYRVVFEKVKD